jgi:hypothetical protein
MSFLLSTPYDARKTFKKQNSNQNENKNEGQNESFNSNEFELYELNPKSHEFLIKKLPKGYRTILLVIEDMEERVLLQIFRQSCFKFHKYLFFF